MVRCRKLTHVISLDASSNAFLASRPEWTLAGAMLSCEDDEDLKLEQTPFRWNDGVWEADVIVERVSPTPDLPYHLTLRIASDTVRRWTDIGINPLVEACAQIKEHLARTRGAGAGSDLVLL